MVLVYLLMFSSPTSTHSSPSIKPTHGNLREQSNSLECLPSNPICSSTSDIFPEPPPHAQKEDVRDRYELLSDSLSRYLQDPQLPIPRTHFRQLNGGKTFAQGALRMQTILDGIKV